MRRSRACCYYARCYLLDWYRIATYCIGTYGIGVWFFLWQPARRAGERLSEERDRQTDRAIGIAIYIVSDISACPQQASKQAASKKTAKSKKQEASIRKIVN